MAPKTFIFANNKGGVGKSTLSVNLAAAFAKTNPRKNVLFCDLTMTRSTSNILLGDAEPASMMKALEDACKLSRTRSWLRSLLQGILLILFGVFIACLFCQFVATSSGPSHGQDLVPRKMSTALAVSRAVPWDGSWLLLAMVGFAILAACLYLHLSQAPVKVLPLEMATKSTLLPNLSVLVGGSSLASLARSGFEWDAAQRGWMVPDSVDVVIFDIDNYLGDHARFALSVSQYVLVPTSTNLFDFERMCEDPINGSLFDFIQELPAELRPKFRCVILNRIRAMKETENEGYAFAISKDDQNSVEATQRAWVEKLGGAMPQFELMREFPGSVRDRMLKERTPIALLSGPDSTLSNARNNLERVANKIFG